MFRAPAWLLAVVALSALACADRQRLDRRCQLMGHDIGSLKVDDRMWFDDNCWCDNDADVGAYVQAAQWSDALPGCFYPGSQRHSRWLEIKATVKLPPPPMERKEHFREQMRLYEERQRQNQQ
jgi:hypothetical protein